MSRYAIFTFQFSPITQSYPSLPGMEIDVDANYSNKNIIFNGVLACFESGKYTFTSKKQQYPHQVVYFEKSIMVLKLAHSGYIMQESDFSRKKLPNSPSCNIIVDNRDNVQRIYIEDRSVAFEEPRYPSFILQETFRKYLKQYGLSISILGEYEPSEFWMFAKEYAGRIKMVRFSFPYPNLPRVTNQIDKALIKAGLSVNSKETTLELKSGKNESLNLKKNNPLLKNIVSACSDSGSPIICSTGTKRKHITIGSALRYLEIDNLDDLLTPELMVSIYNKLIKLLKD